MLDKNKLYYVNKNENSVVRILFEDAISWYAEEVKGTKDAHNNPIRKSFKKTSFRLTECPSSYKVTIERTQKFTYEIVATSKEHAHRILDHWIDADFKNYSYPITRRDDMDVVSKWRIL